MDPWHDAQTFANYSRVADLISFDKLYSVSGVMDLLLEKEGPRFQ
jgi:hypothetical protein